MASHPPRPVAAPPQRGRGFFSVFRYSGRALELVWTTSRALSIGLALLTLIAGVLPAGIAFVGARIVDAVVHAIQAAQPADTRAVLEWVVIEGALVALLAA